MVDATVDDEAVDVDTLPVIAAYLALDVVVGAQAVQEEAFWSCGVGAAVLMPVYEGRVPFLAHGPVPVTDLVDALRPAVVPG